MVSFSSTDTSQAIKSELPLKNDDSIARKTILLKTTDMLINKRKLEIENVE